MALKPIAPGASGVSAQGNGLRVFHSDKSLLGTLPIPEAVANLCFGGTNQEMLFLTAASSLYGITRLPDLVGHRYQHFSFRAARRSIGALHRHGKESGHWTNAGRHCHPRRAFCRQRDECCLV